MAYSVADQQFFNSLAVPLSDSEKALVVDYRSQINTITARLNNPSLTSAQFRSYQNQQQSLQAQIDNIIYNRQQLGDPIPNLATQTVTPNATAQQELTTTNKAPNPASTNAGPLTSAEAAGIKNSAAGPGAGGATSTATEPSTSISAPTVNVTGTFTQPDAPTATLDNVLLQYPSYIYSLSWHLMSDKEYTDTVNNVTFTPKRVLIASAGRWNASTFPRSPYFNEDFYFDELTFETLVKGSDASRDTNVLGGSFTVIEPYGITLMNRLLEATNASDVQTKNYLDQPYLLQIDFFALDDKGEISKPIADITKRIPMQIAKMDIKATVRGSEYRIEFIPYNHSAYNSTYVSTPAGIEVVAKTVAEFFQSNEIVQSQTNTKRSFGTALNEYYSKLKTENKISINDTYDFLFDPDIGTSKFVEPKLVSPRDTKMTDTKTPAEVVTMKRADTGAAGPGVFDPSMRIFSINAGSTIEKIITLILSKSEYIQKQISIPDGDTTFKKPSNDPLKWFKIIPIVTLTTWDDRRKLWGRKITYYVKTYKMYNLRSDVAPQGVMEKAIKAYDYTYTGNNQDIIDFELNFNALYFNAMTAYRDARLDRENIPDDSQSEKTKNAADWKGGSQDPNAIMPLVMKPVVTNARGTTGGAELTSTDVAVADLRESMLSNSGADMLGLKLKILGDPAFIKQDDVFYTPELFMKAVINQKNADPRLTPNGSIIFDDGEIYVQVIFRTPIDIDESTGLMKFEPKYKVSVFSGLYSVAKVTSEFRSGEFTQVLDLIRAPRQSKYDYVGKLAPTQDPAQRSTTTGTSSTPLAPNFDPVPVAGGYDPNNPSGIYTGGGADPAVSETPAQDQTQLQQNQIAPTVNTTDQNALVETFALAPVEPITSSNMPEIAINTPTYAAGWNNFTDTQLAYMQQTTTALGLNNTAFVHPIDAATVAKLKAQLSAAGVQ